MQMQLGHAPRSVLPGRSAVVSGLHGPRMATSCQPHGIAGAGLELHLAQEAACILTPGNVMGIHLMIKAKGQAAAIEHLTPVFGQKDVSVPAAQIIEQCFSTIITTGSIARNRIQAELPACHRHRTMQNDNKL